MLYDGPTRLTLLQVATTAAAIPPPLDVVGLAFWFERIADHP